MNGFTLLITLFYVIGYKTNYYNYMKFNPVTETFATKFPYNYAKLTVDNNTISTLLFCIELLGTILTCVEIIVPLIQDFIKKKTKA